MHTILLTYANSDIDRLPTLTKERDDVYAQLDQLPKGDFEVISEALSTTDKLISYIRSREDTLCLFLFSGHAGRDALIMLDGRANADGIAALLGDCKQLKLVVLNGCSTAGQVKALLNNGVPVVIATSAPVDDETATKFSIYFFKELTKKGQSIREAFDRAMDATKVHSNIKEEIKNRGILLEKEDNETLWGMYYTEQKALSWSLPLNEQTDLPKTGIKPLYWLAFTALGIVLIALLFWSGRLDTLNSQTYYIIIVLVAIVVSAFAYLAFPSTSSYEGSLGPLPGRFKLTGAFVPFVVVLGFGLYFKPDQESPFPFTINVYASDESNKPIDTGEITLQYGKGGNFTKTISEGACTFNEVPHEYKGKLVRYFPKVDGYVSRFDTVTIPKDGSPARIFLKKIPDSVTVSGLVTHRQNPMPNVILVFGNGIAKDTTDAFGNFTVSLPLKDGAEIPLRAYTRGSLRYDNLVTLSQTVPMTIPLR